MRRKVMYKVMGMNGTFNTADYGKATADGCKILETYLVPIDERTEKEKENQRLHVQKAQEKREERRGH